MKILVIDIETSPNTAHVWGLFKQNISIKQLMESSYVLCWSAKWYKEKQTMYRNVHNSDLLTTAWNLLDEADAVVHYNGSNFDIPTLNKEFILHGLKPPSPYKQIDLLKVVRKQFKFPSNKLDYVAQRLGLGRKTRHEGHELWVQCMVDNPIAWKKMERYNRQDVRLTDSLYTKLLPWIPNHPNIALYDHSELPVCSNCGSTRIKKNGVQPLVANTYQRYKCLSCGTNLRGNSLIKSHKHLLRSVR